MEYAPEEYTKFYIEQALFRLMNKYEYEKISVTDIVNKAGVGRATFYRYFKRKEDVINYYFEHNKKRFLFEQRYYPRCKEDFIDLVSNVFAKFKENIEIFKLIRKARLEYIYLDYLNRHFAEKFADEYPNESKLAPYVYAGMLFNVSMAWLDGGCAESVNALAALVVNAIYFEQK